MDILTHTLSGLASGTVFATFANKRAGSRLLIVAVGGLGAALPDIDAISLWSKFDTTIGSFFQLAHSGREIYSAKYWYSHHAFMHSLAAALLIVFLALLVSYILRVRFRRFSFAGLSAYASEQKLLAMAFVAGYLAHLLEDMPTPASAWGGVNFFWPLKTYVGGTGEIWWWNNYDIFLIVLAAFSINGLLLLLAGWVNLPLRRLCSAVVAIAAAAVLAQIKTRPYDFAYTGSTPHFAQYEAESKQLQHEILGDKIYHMAETLDKKLPVHF